MLLEFLKPSVNQEPGSISYILNNSTAIVLRGNPLFTQLVIDNSPAGLSQRFVSGVINNLIDLDGEHDELLLDELESLLLAGRPKSAMPWCAIQHTDKGKREIHFVIPFYDLLTGKFIHPYLDRIDRKAFQAWVEHFALRHDLGLPHEKLRTRPPFDHLRNIRKSDREFLENVWNFVHARVEDKTIKSRENLEYELIHEGYNARFKTYAGGRLEQPEIVGPDGNKLRLTNSVYYRLDFGSPRPKPLDRNKKEDVTKRLDELNEIIRKWRDFRAFQMIGRLFGKGKQPKPHQRISKRILKQLIEQHLAKATPRIQTIQNKDFNMIFLSAYLHKTDFSSVCVQKSKVPDHIDEIINLIKIPSEDGLTEVEDTASDKPNPLPTRQPGDAVSEAFQPLVTGENSIAPMDPLVVPIPMPIDLRPKKNSRQNPSDLEV